MCSPPKTLCAKCYKALQSAKYVKCCICNSKLHLFCADIDEQSVYSVIQKTKNIVYNCDDCLKTSKDLVTAVCTLSAEVTQLKECLKSLLCERIDNSVAAVNSCTSKCFLSSLSASEHENNAKHNEISNVPIITNIQMTNKAKPNNILAAVSDGCGPSSVANVDSNAHVVNKTKSIAFSAAFEPFSSSLAASADVPTTSGNFRKTAAVVVSNENIGFVANDQNSVCTETTHSHALSSHPQSSNTATNNPANISEWVSVSRKRNNRNKAFIIGQNKTNDLDVVARRKWVHISSFKSTVSEDAILNYVGNRLDISLDHILCRKLVKKDVDVSTLRSVSFKLGISEAFYKELFKPEVWPEDVKVRPFQFFPKDKAISEQT